jgi:multidrug efflux pump
VTLSGLAVRRPVLAGVASALIVVAGLIAFRSLPLRELPDVDNPTVSVSANYPGANAEVVENRVTRVIEDQLSGIDGVDTIQSQSQDGRSNINITFRLSRDLEAAANDVRDRVSRVAGNLPAEVEDVEVSKQDADASPFMWFSASSESRSTAELSDFVRRNVVDRLAVIDGVAMVRSGGGQDYAMRIELDRREMAARGLTVDDIEGALRRQNVELPGGAIESDQVDLTVRIDRTYLHQEEFRRLPVGQSIDGHVIRLGEVADVYLGVQERRSLFRGDGLQRVGVGIVRQSKSNVIEVADGVRAEVERLTPGLPDDITIVAAQDDTKFVRAAVSEVWRTLAISFALVVAIIYLFLGSLRAVLVPAVVVPVSLIGVFAVLAVFGFTINILTLLAMVLAIGLVVDDSIVVLENIQRRIDMGEPRLIAADRGARQVFFAVVATTAVVVAVFAPLAILTGYVGRLFVELAITISGAVIISAFVALTLSPMMSSKLLAPRSEGWGPARLVSGALDAVSRSYAASLSLLLRAPVLIALFMIAIAGSAAYMFFQLETELTPPEDRGQLFIQYQASEGAGFDHTATQADEIEAILLEYVESGEAETVIVRVPGFGGSGNSFNSGIAILPLASWDTRTRSGLEIQREVSARLGQLTGVRAFAGMRSPFGGGGEGNDIEFVLTGPDYELLDAAAEDLIGVISTENPRLQRPRKSYEPTAQQLGVEIDRERAAALGVSVQSIGRALEAQLGSRRVGQFVDGGEGYDVILQNKPEDRATPDDLTNIFVRSESSGRLIPLTNLVSVSERGEASSRPRINRSRAVTISLTLADGYSLGDAVNWLSARAHEVLPPEVQTEYLGAAKDLREANNAVLFAFVMALLIVFLVLAGQFESVISPIVIMLTVPLAVAGGLFGLLMTDSSLNIYSQIGLIILVGLAAKNGILIVEFANQLREAGRSVREATIEAATTRLRPILMTSVSTAFGSLPLVLSHGAGAESRMTIGVVILSGVLVATMFTLIVVPVFYALLARFMRTPGWVGREIAEFERREGPRAEDEAFAAAPAE